MSKLVKPFVLYIDFMHARVGLDRANVKAEAKDAAKNFCPLIHLLTWKRGIPVSSDYKCDPYKHVAAKLAKYLVK